MNGNQVPAATAEYSGATPAARVRDWPSLSLGAASLLMLVATALAVAMPICLNPAFFFSDDMKHQHLPVMMEIGRRLREGEFPAVTDLSGFGGNLLGEYQYGLYNPVSLLLYLVLPSFPNLGDAAALLAVAHYFILAAGVFVLALEVGARPFAAALAAVMMVTNLFLAYWFASAWLPGLIATAWLPWALAMLHKARRDFRFIPAGAVATYLLNTSGWPHAVIALAIMVSVLFLLEERNRGSALHGGWFALIAGFLASIPAWIPLAAFVRVAHRTNAVDDLNGMFVPPLNGLLNAGFPSQLFMMMGLHGWQRSSVPFLFAGVAVLIVPALVRWNWWHHHLRQVGCWLTIALIFMFLAIGPSQIGPLRWPVRYVPYFHLVLCVLTSLLISHAKLDSTRRGLLGALMWCALALLIAWQQTTDELWNHLAALGLLVGATLGVWRLAGRPRAVSLFLIAVTLMTWLLALEVYPSNTDLNAWRVPNERGRYLLPPTVTHDDVVLTLMNSGPTFEGEVEHGVYSGNMGMMAGMRSWNGYSPMRPAALAKSLCMDQFGWTCRDLLPRLTTIDPETHLNRLQLMGVTRVILDKLHGWWHRPVEIAGATLCHEDDFVMVYCLPRMYKYPVTWSSSPTSYSVLESSAETIRLTVTTSAPGTDVLFGRAWYPGLTARLDGRALPAGISRYGLVRVRIPATRGGVLELHWGYPGAIGAWLSEAAALLTIGLGLGFCATGARRLKHEPIPMAI